MPRQDGDLPNIAVPGIVSTRAESYFATFVRNCPPGSHGHERDNPARRIQLVKSLGKQPTNTFNQDHPAVLPAPINACLRSSEPLYIRRASDAACSFWGNVGRCCPATSQNPSPANSATSAFVCFRSGARSAFLGFGRSPGVDASSAVTGTLTVIDGDTLYITDASGGIVKVTIGQSTKVTRNASASAAALQA
ncbi:MAG: hypothetical protein M1399_02800 [Actinobacteria bacterium]|nr:hypothetical protein [Actinomycetota bacterium]MCL5446338.1 hypothetical protein [Actinomycetota bacterium]